MTDLGTLPGDPGSEALGISPDGRIVRCEHDRRQRGARNALDGTHR